MSVEVGFIGAGNIVRAILAGVDISGNCPRERIGIFDVSEKVCGEFRQNGYIIYPSIEDLVKNASVAVVAVTPQVIEAVVPEMKKGLSKNSILLSVAAGISTEWYQEKLGENCKVVRCMPTLTAQAGMGAFAVSRGKNVSENEFQIVREFLMNCGIVEEIEEDLMCEVVSINGSAPGYFYHMAKVVMEEAVHMGFSEDTALRLFAQTMKGSAETMLSSGMSVETLEGKLRLPGGTTVAALEKMEELGFDRCLREGLKACTLRCRELGQM